MKTNAARILDQKGIAYHVKEYEWDEEELDAVSAAAKLGLPPEQMFKTLVLKGDKTGVLVACIPANGELDLKTLASVSGNKKVDLVPVKELLGLTGYVRGGCSPLGMKKQYPTYIDETAEILDLVSISAGQRGLQLWLSGSDLLAATAGKPAAICR